MAGVPSLGMQARDQENTAVARDVAGRQHVVLQHSGLWLSFTLKQKVAFLVQLRKRGGRWTGDKPQLLLKLLSWNSEMILFCNGEYEEKMDNWRWVQVPASSLLSLEMNMSHTADSWEVIVTFLLRHCRSVVSRKKIKVLRWCKKKIKTISQKHFQSPVAALRHILSTLCGSGVTVDVNGVRTLSVTISGMSWRSYDSPSLPLSPTSLSYCNHLL